MPFGRKAEKVEEAIQLQIRVHLQKTRRYPGDSAWTVEYPQGLQLEQTLVLPPATFTECARILGQFEDLARRIEREEEEVPE